MSDLTRRSFLTWTGMGALSVAALALAGCSPSGSGGDGSIRFAWWGGSDRQRAYLAALDAFTAEHPEIKVAPEFGDYDAYQERMTTQMAARDVPDVFWIPSPAVLTYRDAGLYRDLDGIGGLDLGAFGAEQVETFRLGGELNTLPKSIFSPVVRWNTTFQEEDGVSLPDQLTWDGLAELLVDYSKNNAGGRKGTTYGPYHDMPFESFLRQRGEDLWTEDGRLGASVDGVAAWIDWWEKLRLAGATTSVSEQDGIEPSWAQVGDKVLLTFANSNHIVDDAQAFPDHVFDQRDVPAAEDAAAGYHFTYYSRFAMYSGVPDDRVEAAAALMSFNLNSPELLSLVGLSAGAPPNADLLDAYEPDATPDEQKVIAITREIAGTEQRPRYEAPAGSGSWRDLMIRELEEVTLGQKSVPDAAAAFVEAVEGEIAGA
ncbi:ABC transporter substrate-binding protein [Promicromonospora sp. MEB111]|uniref:ABC transporter substrate-binding protein n=1 Tax=Promicromonospora sp. MEB111 TaxID=3040301 RepID=UPI00254E785C|nr:ABC transporter substrate-binding protein [Promicromonospora sp. MEB111]